MICALVGESPGLVCIEYPGVVENPEKAVRTLGGLDNIGLVLSEPNRRLELRFRSEDVYCKPTCGERHQCSCKHIFDNFPLLSHLITQLF